MSSARSSIAPHGFCGVRGDLDAENPCGAITTEIAREALVLLEIDEQGLDREARELLRTIAVKFDGGPVGLSTLAASLGEEQETIEDVYEPYLLQLGYIQRTPRGRTITTLGRAHVGASTDEVKLF